MSDAVNERLAEILDRTGDFRILRRVPTPVVGPLVSGNEAGGLATAIVIDTETTASATRTR